MNLSGIREGDIIQADVKGRRFFALVKSKEQGTLKIEPLVRGITYFSVGARDVNAHWRKAGRKVKDDE